jgi:hypothetical protein
MKHENSLEMFKGDMVEILWNLRMHLLVPDYYVVGRNVDLMISRAIGLVGCVQAINALSEKEQNALYQELNRMAMRTREYAELNDELIREIAEIKSTCSRHEYTQNYLNVLNKKKAG